MKPLLQFLIIVFLANSNISCAQKIISFKISPADNSISLKPYKSGDDADNGQRKIKMTLLLSGKSKKDRIYDLAIKPNTAASAPRLSTSKIRIKGKDFNSGTFDTVLTVNLKLLECLKSGEQFKIEIKKVKFGLPAQNKDSIAIDQIIPPNPGEISLIDDTTFVKPYLKSDKTDNGQRTLILNLNLTGKQLPVLGDTTLDFIFPPYTKSPPKFISGVGHIVRKTSFDTSGCPQKIKVPIIIQLAPVDELKTSEDLKILISKNQTADYKHAHTLIVRQEIKGIENPKIKIDSTKFNFIHPCTKGKNFKVKLQPDSIGGVIRVVLDGTKIDSTFPYKYFFHSRDFTTWLINVFLLKETSKGCDECTACVSSLAERVEEELEAEKKQKTQEASTAIKTSITDTQKKADSVKIENNIPDTFHIIYADTSNFTLVVTKEKDLTIMELCKGLKGGTGDCQKQFLVDLNKESFNGRLSYMLQKLTGLESVESVKIKPFNVYEKYQENLAAKKTKEKTAFQKLYDNRGAEIDSEKVTITDIGIISLKDSTGKIKIYNDDASELKETEISKVKISIGEGKLLRKELKVFTKDGVFYNRKAPIPVSLINERGDDHLTRSETPNDNSYILLRDVLEYEGDGYVPDDTVIILTPAKKTKTLSATSNLNSLINFSLYTDLAGLLGRRANGIINTDVSGKFITNTNNIWNRDITLAAFVEGNLVLSKFDSKFKSIDSSAIKIGKNGQKDTVDRMQMMQTAWLKGAMKFNLISFRVSYNQYLQINAGTRINVVNGDSLFKKDRDIIFFDYYPEITYSIQRLKNFGMDISLRWLQQRVADKEPFANNGWESVFNPQIGFFYYPIAKQNSKIYLRFNYFANRKKDANNFYQLQFGIKTDLKFGSNK